MLGMRVCILRNYEKYFQKQGNFLYVKRED